MALTHLSGGNFSGRSDRLRAFAWERGGQYLHPDLEINLSGLAQRVGGEYALHGLAPPNWTERRLSTLSGGEKASLLLDCALALGPDRLAIDGALEQLDIARRESALSRLQQASERIDILISDDTTAEPAKALDHQIASASGEMASFNQSLLEVPSRFAECTGTAHDLLARELTFRYSRRSDPVFNATSFSLKAGTVNLLRAPNGAGKSTLARLMVGVLKPVSGWIGTSKGAGVRGGIFYAFQNPRDQLFGRRCTDYLATVMRLGEARRDAWTQEWDDPADVANAFGLAPFLESEVAEMPLVARKRLGLAGAFASRAPWLFLDEPALGLDHLGRHNLARLVEASARAGRGVIVVSHGEEFEHLARLERITIAGGQLSQGGPYE
jgi:energy-coupling factor transport system ATP-binding protein